MHERLRRPHGTTDHVHSPSLVLAEHLEEGSAYPLEEFGRRSREALTEAGERVRATDGFSRGRAPVSRAGIEARLARRSGGEVVVEAIER